MALNIDDKILNMAETKTGLFQVTTDVGFPERIRRVSEIEGPLVIGHFGLTEMEETAIIFEVIDDDTVQITDVQSGNGNITIYPEARGKILPTLLPSINQNGLAGSRRIAKYKPFAPAFAITPHGGIIETRTITVCSLPVGKYKPGKTFP